MLKKPLAAATALALFVSFAACSNGSTDDPNATGSVEVQDEGFHYVISGRHVEMRPMCACGSVVDGISRDLK